MWLKTGLVFKNHAQLPTVEKKESVYRVYYSFRINSESHINYFELDSNLKLLYENKNPVFSPGERGTFDDGGVMPSCICNNLMYYTGWNTKTNVPYGHAIGVAKFNKEKNKFERIGNCPILDRGNNVPFLANSPFVSNNKMYFCNGTGWEENFPTYEINCAYFDKVWIVSKKIKIGNKGEACSRPFLHKKSIYFSKKTKNTNYSIFKYLNKNTFEVLKPSKTGWDSEMVCYPYIIDNLMFYNGNGYGKTGIGVAVWK